MAPPITRDHIERLDRLDEDQTNAALKRIMAKLRHTKAIASLWTSGTSDDWDAALRPSRIGDPLLVGDKLHNARAILRDYRECGEELWARFNGGRDGILWYYRAPIDAFRRAALRVFYEVARAERSVVRILAIGKKARNVLRIAGQEIKL